MARLGGTFKSGGESYTLRFSFGALCHYEDLTDKGLGEGLQEIQSAGEAVRFKSLIPVIQAGLFDTNPSLSVADVMSLDPDGGVKALIEAITAAAAAAFPDDDEEDAGNGSAGKTGKR